MTGCTPGATRSGGVLLAELGKATALPGFHTAKGWFKMLGREDCHARCLARQCEPPAPMDTQQDGLPLAELFDELTVRMQLHRPCQGGHLHVTASCCAPGRGRLDDRGRLREPPQPQVCAVHLSRSAQLAHRQGALSVQQPVARRAPCPAICTPARARSHVQVPNYRRVFAHDAAIFHERGIARPDTGEVSSLGCEPWPGTHMDVSLFEFKATPEALKVLPWQA